MGPANEGQRLLPASAQASVLPVVAYVRAGICRLCGLVGPRPLLLRGERDVSELQVHSEESQFIA